ncbi:MAG: hypothetical protein WAM79_00825 [Candidatus Sulfotelmatobacter sp.]
MTLRPFSNVLRLSIPGVLATAFLCLPSLAQGPIPSVPDAPVPSVEPIHAAITPAPALAIVAPTRAESQHRFWDRENIVLFSANAALNAADFAITRANLQSGGQELNPIVRVFGRSTAGLTVNFAGETAGVMSISYFFHRTGHHKLERAISLVNIGGSAGAVSYDLANR